MTDSVGPQRVQIARTLTDVQQRLADALALDIAHNQPPDPSTVPVVMLNWDMQGGIIRVAHALQSELDVHVCYLRVCDVQLSFAEMMQRAAMAHAQRPDLKALGEVMAGQARRRIVGRE